MFLILYFNLKQLTLKLFLFTLIVSIGIIIIGYLLHHFTLFKNKNVKIYALLLIITGIFIRIYLINNLDFKLESDFAFFFNNALGIISGTLPDVTYLSFNGYAYLFASIISIIIRIFGESLNIILGFNLICQLLTVLIIYKTISIKYSQKSAYILSTGWFLLPTVIFANLLVSTETFFMLIFACTVYLLLKIIDYKEVNKKNVLNYILLGILMSLSNNIRPIMLIFVIALVIYFVLTAKNLKSYLLLVICLFVYFFSNFLFNTYIEHKINHQTQAGALEWSLYFGANKNSCGSWTEADSGIVFDTLYNNKNGSQILIQKTTDRYKEMGLLKTGELMHCKFQTLWTDNNSTYNFVVPLLTENPKIDINKYNLEFSKISLLMVLTLIIFSILNSLSEFKNKRYNSLFIQLFTIGYILSNLLVVLNGRYNFPLYFLLILISAPYLSPILNENKIKNLKKEK